MSTETIREIAEREADEAERDEREAEPEQEGEPGPDFGAPGERDGEAEAEPEPPSDAVIEKALGEIRTKAANYTKAQAKLLAQTGLPWTECPTCQVAGFVAPFDPSDPDEYERKAATDAYFQDTAPEYREASDAITCPDCDGYGELISGSARPEFRLKPCAFCAAKGWIDPAQVKAREDASAYTPPAAPAIATSGAPTPGPDLWARPYGHRDYGVPPALVGA